MSLKKIRHKRNMYKIAITIALTLTVSGCANSQTNQNQNKELNVSNVENVEKTESEADSNNSEENIEENKASENDIENSNISENDSTEDTEASDEKDTNDGASSNSGKVNADRRRTRKKATVCYDDLEHFEITSENIKDGAWDREIGNTNDGENLSPKLCWDEVEGANYYAVYMIDGSWLHLEALTEKNSLEKGEIDGNNNNKYVGPYPPDGIHTYNVYVIALKNKPGKVSTSFDSSGNEIDLIISNNDNDEDGNTGNVISAGLLSGTFASLKNK